MDRRGSAPPRQRRALTWAAVLVSVLLALSACASSGAADTGSSSSSTRGTSSGKGQVSEATPPKYVALGDSYTSAPLVPVTDVADGCFRSSMNYPALVAAALGASLEDRSCAGARTENLTTPERPGIPAQLPSVQADVDLVTVGLGGNDGGVFRQLTNRCPALRARDPEGAPCRAEMTAQGGDALLTALKKTSKQLSTALTEVRRRAPDAQVLAVGYPQIVAADGVCAQLPLAKGDYAYAAGVNRALNDAVRDAARASGTTYLDVYAKTKGHDICSKDPWVNGAVTDQRRALAYHPFAAGQKAVADLVVAATRR